MRCLLYLVFFFLFLPERPVTAQPAKLVRGPYLQVATTKSVVVRWRTDQPTDSRVTFGTRAGQFTQQANDTQSTTEHIVTLTGLQPATKYYYTIGSSAGVLAVDTAQYVRTAPVPGSTGPSRFWVLGDFGNGSDNQRSVYQAYLQATATHPADLWLWLGDNAYSYGLEDEYQQYVFPLYAPTLRNTPIFITPGNHEYADSETNFNIAYYKLFSFPQQGEAGGIPSGSKSYYSADYGHVHFISLDSQGREDGQFRLYDTTTTQVQWLKRDLAANKLPWTIVIFHHPPYSKGGHNSDTEESMRLLRENLTPILERYNVDLVLNGHSHGYERSYRLKGLRGLANTFDKNSHVAENTTGRYDGSPNSCPILTKGQGTVYVVNGSGGQVGGQSPDYPHPATIYNNVTVGGSMILDVNENRLDAQFILADGSVPDKFTIMKNVNKKAAFSIEYADTLQLSASWVGDYHWPGGQTSRNVRYAANQAGTIPVTVTDARQCLADQFTLTVQQPPKLTTKLTASTAICVGSILAVTATPENTTKAAGWQYDILLSDASGNFNTEQLVGSGSLTTLKATIPANLTPGTGYRLRVRPRGIAYAQLVSSDAFAIKPLPTATLAGSTTVLQGLPISLTLAFTGDGPWRGTLSDGTAFSTSVTPTVLTIQPTKSVVYSITSVENSCGKGSSSGQASITVLLPTGEEDFVGGHLRIFPNPAHDVVYIELTTTQKKEVTINLLDLQGRLVSQKYFGALTSLSEGIPLPYATGTYLLKVQVGQNTLMRKVVRQ